MTESLTEFVFASPHAPLPEVCTVVFHRLASRFEQIGFDISLVTTEWFLCLFAKSFPSEVLSVPLFVELDKCVTFERFLPNKCNRRNIMLIWVLLTLAYVVVADNLTSVGCCL